MTIHAFAAMEPRAALQPFSYATPELGAHDIELEVTHCGLCYSDIHLIDDDWKKSRYPIVPGHEVVGRVVRRGAEVAHLQPGQRVGVGWQHGACLVCELCVAGHENLCPTQTATCVGHHGGLAGGMIADARFALPIPEALASAAAPPLLCGGVTVYAPMRRYGVTSASRVGVIGVGGLGHMAIALLSAIGAEIVAFSTSPDKRAQALRMGAHDYVGSTDIREIRKLGARFDLILSTVHARLDWVTYLMALRPTGVLCLLGGGTGLLQLSQQALLGQRAITTGEIGSRAAIAEVLAFAAHHRIAPEIEIAPMHESQRQIDRLRANQVRYRAVLENH